MDSTSAHHAPKRLWSLDVFRGICALTVFLTHWHVWCTFTPITRLDRFLHEFLSNGFDLFTRLAWNTGGHHPAVIGFFVLSGFCIHASHCGKTTDAEAPVDWIRYFKNRAKRILPVYWFAALLGFCFVALQTWYPAASPLLDFHATGAPLDFLLRFSGLSGLYPREVFAGNSTLNTVATELVIYAVYPLFLICARRGAWKSMAALALLAQLCMILCIPFWPAYWVYSSPPVMALFWYVGALSARWHFANERPFSGWFSIAWWLGFAAARELSPFFGRTLLLQILWCAACACGLLWLAGHDRRSADTGSRFGVPALRRLGLVSYSLYAVHTPVMMLVTWAMITVSRTGPLSYSLQLLLTLAATTFTTFATYHFLESRYLRSRAERARTPELVLAR